MTWRTWYKEHLFTPAQAVQQIKSGQRVVVAHACGEPSIILDALVAHAAQYENVEIIHMVAMGKAAYCQPQYDKNFHHNAFFLGGSTRAAAAEGRVDFTPVYFSEIPSLLREDLRPNVTLLQCSPPDAHGYVSLGVSVDYTKPAAEASDLVIAQVNQNMPRTLGDSFLHVTQIGCLVEADTPVIELAPPKIGDVERAIGENVASLVRDGDTLQLGIGAIPDAVLLFLKEKNDLGIHTEMFADGVLPLVEKGVINGEAKNIDKGKMVSTFLMGSQRVYDFIDDNPGVLMMDVGYTNDPFIIAKNDRVTAINSALQVDITGQVCADSLGTKFYSGVGGQIDFIYGASLSKGGKAIIAMPSVTNKGISKIAPELTCGAGVVTTRNHIHWFVTENGAVNLYGKSLQERARLIISIADPSAQESLDRAAFERYGQHHHYVKNYMGK